MTQALSLAILDASKPVAVLDLYNAVEALLTKNYCPNGAEYKALVAVMRKINPQFNGG